MKAIAYCRVSSREQVGGTSLTTQEESIRALCLREGVDLVQVFREKGESAKTADRTELIRMLAFCEAHSVDVVLVWKFDRFARNLEQHFQLRTQLRAAGVQLRSVTEPITEDPVGRLMENVLASFAQFDNDVRGQRAREGLAAKARQGYWIGMPPVGYRRGSINGHLEPDGDRADFVREAFERVAVGGESIESILTSLIARGFTTSRGNPVTRTTLHRALRNPIYAGRVVMPKLGIDTEAIFEPLVRTELFDRVQRQVVTAPQQRSGDDMLPLRRFASCDECGRPFTGAVTRSKGREYAYYRCPACRGTNVRRHDLHRRFASRLAELRLDPRLEPAFELIATESFRRDRRNRSLGRTAITRRLADPESRERTLRQAFIYDRRIERDVYEEESASLAAGRQRLERELAEVTGLPDIEPEFIVAQTRHVVQDPAGTWKRLDGPARREFQRLVCPDGVTVRDGECLKPTISPLFSAIAALKRGEMKYGGADGI